MDTGFAKHLFFIGETVPGGNNKQTKLLGIILYLMVDNR
jgi:hypothetical protein